MASPNTPLKTDQAKSAPVEAKSAPKPVQKKETEDINIPQTLALFLSVIIPNLLLVLVLSDVSIGAKVANAFSPKMYDYGGSGMIFLCGFMLAIYWVVEARGAVALVLGFLGYGCFLLGSLLKVRNYPWLPMVFAMFHIPLLCGILRHKNCPKVHFKQFYKVVAITTLFGSAALLAVWIYWVVSKDNWWNDNTKLRLAAECPKLYESVYKDKLDYITNCVMDRNAHYSISQRKDVKKACAKATTLLLMVWAAPLIGFLCNFFIGLFSLLNAIGLKDIHSHESEKSLKIFVMGLGVFVMGMYLSASVSGASFRAASTLMAFFAAALTALLGWTYLECRDVLEENLLHSHFAMMVWKAAESDWAKAMFLGGFNIFLPIFLFLDYLRNVTRKKTRKDYGETCKTTFTPETQLHFNKIMTEWNLAGILMKICLLGELYFTFQVGVSKITYLFLSWLNTELGKIKFGITLVLVFIIGVSMFLLPPVPGGAVYLFGGVVIADQARRSFSDENTGFIIGCIIACTECWALKLVACVGQYYIGYLLGGYTKVQQIIGVDKVATRALEAILKKPGLSVGKVAILVGGPDWPTSVTYGILRLSVPRMLMGTLPIIFVVGPGCMAGAFASRVDPAKDSSWNMLMTMATGIFIVTQIATMFVAMQKITAEIEENGEAFKQSRQEHQAVEELTKAEEAGRKVFDDVTKWDRLSPPLKAIITTAASLQVGCGFVFCIFDANLFRQFSVSSKIAAPESEGGLDDKPYKIVQEPQGWFVLGLFFFGCFLHYIFVQITQSMARRELADRERSGAPTPQVVGKPEVGTGQVAQVAGFAP